MQIKIVSTHLLLRISTALARMTKENKDTILVELWENRYTNALFLEPFHPSCKPVWNYFQNTIKLYILFE